MPKPTTFKKEYIEQARKLCQLGATDVQMSDFFNVCEKTLNNWKNAHPEFKEALVESKRELDMKVVGSLYERAMGYKHKEEKVFCNNAGEVTTVETEKQYAPDVTAIIFWLKNRQPELWKDRHDIHTSGETKVKIMRKRFDGSKDD